MKRQTIIQIYNTYNSAVFNNILNTPHIRVTKSRSYYAAYEWIYTGPIMWFALRYIQNINMAKDIVYHEMIHQYVEEVLNVTEDDHHGPIFWHYYKKLAPKDILLFEELD